MYNKIIKFGDFTTVIVLKDSPGLENQFNGLVDEIWEDGRVLM